MEAALSRPHSPPVLRLLAHDLRWQLLTLLARGDHYVRELVRTLDQPTNLVSYHLRLLRRAGLVRGRRSSPDARDVYYSLDLARLHELYLAAGRSLHPALALRGEPAAEEAPGAATRTPARVLFLCTHNSARSQLAEGIMRHLGGPRVGVVSAGSAPASVHPEALRVLASLGIDASAHCAKHMGAYADKRFDYIITVCDRVREACPVFPGDPERFHWSFPDPCAIADEEECRRAFDQTAHQLTTRIRYLLTLIDRERRG